MVTDSLEVGRARASWHTARRRSTGRAILRPVEVGQGRGRVKVVKYVEDTISCPQEGLSDQRNISVIVLCEGPSTIALTHALISYVINTKVK